MGVLHSHVLRHEENPSPALPASRGEGAKLGDETAAWCIGPMSALAIRPIKTKADYRAALKDAERLWDAVLSTLLDIPAEILIQPYEIRKAA